MFTLDLRDEILGLFDSMSFTSSHLKKFISKLEDVRKGVLTAAELKTWLRGILHMIAYV